LLKHDITSKSLTLTTLIFLIFLLFLFIFSFFFFNDTATTEIYTLSLHDALPISGNTLTVGDTPYDILASHRASLAIAAVLSGGLDRKSTRLNSSHLVISYAVFCLKKKIKK